MKSYAQKSLDEVYSLSFIDHLVPQVLEELYGATRKTVERLFEDIQSHAEFSRRRIDEKRSNRREKGVFKGPELDEFKELVADLMFEHNIQQSDKIKRLCHDGHVAAANTQRQITFRHLDQMQDLSGVLGLPWLTRDSDQQLLAECRLANENRPLERRFAKEDHSASFALQQGNLELLESKKSYQDWSLHATSCLLLLSGQDATSGASSLCWISPMALEFCDSLKHEEGCLAVFVPTTNILKRSGATRDVSYETTLLSYILYQLLQHNEKLREDLYCVIKRDSEKSRSTPEANNTAFELLEMTLQHLDDSIRYYLVVDEVMLPSDENQEPHDFFCTLAGLVLSESLKVKIKVLAISSSWRWVK
ncbi:hypothetical protein SBOR_8567 [Sclerotinia borealis F-4128]|uniref:Nephrocystin 3-like N-terminal domain-containing protein n=1 Tax=Sclerotinia borealis (strain F-4128) TaxID=1432307 RepID=W9C5P1_SCLBF|nr:hypothetical protein SBOR_8567 [Sclerotinia borealis F-4128]